MKKKKAARRMTTEKTASEIADLRAEHARTNPKYEDYVKLKEQEDKKTAQMEAALDVDDQWPMPADMVAPSTWGTPVFTNGTTQQRDNDDLRAEARQIREATKKVQVEERMGMSGYVLEEAAPVQAGSGSGPSNVRAFTGGTLPKKAAVPPPSFQPSQPVRRTTATIGRKYAPSYQTLEPMARLEDDEDAAALMPELDEAKATLPADMEMFDTVRDAFRIKRVPERTLINVVIVDRTGEQNSVVGIRCYGGVAFGGYAKDCSADAYLVECAQTVQFGSVPFSLKLTMPKCGSWSVEIPIPERVLVKSFSPAQRKMLAELREKFPKDRYDIHYLQMLLAN